MKKEKQRNKAILSRANLDKIKKTKNQRSAKSRKKVTQLRTSKS